MTKLYTEAGEWIVPGKQGRKAERVNVPSSPGELAAWLNERNVPADPGGPELWPGEKAELAAANGDEPAPCYTPVEPVDPAAEKIPGHCRSCGRSAAGTLKLELGNDLSELSRWLEDRTIADLWAIQRAAELIQERVRAIGGRVSDGGRA